MKEYQLYRNPVGGFQPVVLMSDYGTSPDRETRYIVVQPYDGRRLLSPVIITPEEFDEYETLGRVTIYPEEDQVKRVADAFVNFLIEKTKSGKLILDVKYTKEGQTIVIDGSLDVNEILRQIL